MCGIAGKININNKNVSFGEIERMIKAIDHRGPDDRGVFVNGNVGLGHCRLSILDLSVLGHQPMSDENQEVWITFNGEIYNFLELKEELIKQGHSFKSKSDTEVIICLYKKYGVQCLKYLRGMFSFVIWDKKNKKVFGARDRIGKKPFKYFFDGNTFIFASELKAILTNSEVKKEPDFEAINHYLTLQYVPDPLTGFKNIKKLPPAHYVILENGKLEIKRYWKIDYSKKEEHSEKEWQEKIIEKLKESVRLRMISDVPIGAFLSGGVDSSAVVALMSQLSSHPIKTFSIGFQEEDFNELPYAKIIVDQYKIDHNEFIVQPNALEILNKFAYHYEEPFADPAVIPTWYISEITKKYVSVALNGDGGDENFAGYNRYDDYLTDYNRYKIFSLIKNKNLKIVLDKILSKIHSSKIEKLRRLLRTTEEEVISNYSIRMSYFPTVEKERIYADSFKKQLGNIETKVIENLFDESGIKDTLDKVLYVDFNSYLPGALMPKVDIATMAHALESRSPFLDHEFVEMTSKIPSSLKIKNGEKKYILKKALEGILPNEILYRPKMGFGIPLTHWFRKDLKMYVRDKLLSEKALARGIFKKEEIKNLIDAHADGKADNATRLWALLFLEEWFRIWID